MTKTKPFLIYLKNKTTSEFEYRGDVSEVVRTTAGYQIYFNNDRCYNYGAEKVRFYPYVSTRNDVRIYVDNKPLAHFNTVDFYDRYLIFRNKNSYSNPYENNESIEICDLDKTNIKQSEVAIDYFKEILEQSGGISFDAQSDETETKDVNQISAGILLNALEKIDPAEQKSVLSSYIAGVNPALPPFTGTLIYPFGCNESQKLAVENTFANSLSIIEGPPGTGKTQTILNIIANLVIQNKTIALVSNNNSAVFNVREKLQKNGYGRLVASLGNKDNIESFFRTIKDEIPDKITARSPEQLAEAYDAIRNLNDTITETFQYRNSLAKLKSQLSEAEIEFRHIQSDQPIDADIKATLDKKFHRKWDAKKILKLKKALPDLLQKEKFSFFNKIQLLLQFGLFNVAILYKFRDDLNTYLNHKYYEQLISGIQEDISVKEKWLTKNNENTNLNRFTETSKEIFDAVLYDKYNQLDKALFSVENYRKDFNEFVKHYPVILSSTLSLYNCTPKGFLYDYLIIDESSQVDIIKSAVCFSCCKNIVIVGDSMQLTHIVGKETKEIAEQIQQKYQISDAYDYIRFNILDSLKYLYGDKIKAVLLKEHYRCHPLIIGFCNKKYYNNGLVIMTNGANHPFRIIETSIGGGYEKYNQRQIDETDLYIRENYDGQYDKVGVVSPYRDHADKLKKQLPESTEADTIHKYQGREKDSIFFNTVTNQIVDFIDNQNLINVAVSRAIKEFIVVKPKSMELPHGTNIGDLIRYMEYTADPADTIVQGKI
ncbi:MAG: DEAD/DEAH box helicase, partial [Bacteroidales bacterium]